MHQAIPYNSRRSSDSWPSTSSSPSPPLPPPFEDQRPTQLDAASEALELRCGGSSSGSGDGDSNVSKEADDVKKAVEENPVVVVGRRGCFMVHVALKLLLGQGVNPTVCEIGGEIDAMVPLTAGGDNESPEKGSRHVEEGKGQQKTALPAVYIGGKLVGGVDQLMAVHISGELVPILKQAGALWL